ncbi:MAG TPA: Hsp20/alpha crystallin family protein [Candidatus Hydrogenedentes bacterium]|nr:Hsp20/alpha crystallin family protein [Candidatus Hydrogenedentota bacterium]
MTTETKQKAGEVFMTPRIDIIEQQDAVRIEAELPGVAKTGVEIQVEGDELTLTGRRRSDAQPGRVLVRERRLQQYRRVFALSRAVDSSKIKAEMRDGVLTLTIPKAEHMKPKQIPIV